jgi:hypothetical protein
MLMMSIKVIFCRASVGEYWAIISVFVRQWDSKNCIAAVTIVRGLVRQLEDVGALLLHAESGSCHREVVGFRD